MKGKEGQEVMSQSNKLNKPDSLNIKIIIAAHKKYRMPQDDIPKPSNFDGNRNKSKQLSHA